MKLAVDIGNRNICICYNDRGSLKFDSFQSRFSTELQQDYSGSEVIEINNVKYCIEQGMYDFEFNKSNKQYLPLLLCAIARSTKDEKIELMISAPVEHVLGLRDELKNQLEGKSFKFLYNNKPRKLAIERLGVIGEGFSTYFTLERHVRASIRNLGILDIGGRTTNVVTFVNGKQHTSCSINKGILDVKNTMLKKEKECGKDYDIITIENLIENKRLKIDNISKKQLIDDILNQMKIYKIDVELFNWFVTGGGSIDIGSVMLDEVFGNDCMVDNPLYSNVNGNYNFMVSKWGE